MILLVDAKEAALAGRAVEQPWELFRLANYPGRDHEAAVAELGEWARDNGMEIEFNQRQVNDLAVIYVLLTAR